MSENARAIRYKLNKMDRTFFKEVGIAFVKDKNPHDVPHWHDCYEIEYVLSGTVVQHINDYQYASIPGDLVLLTPNDFHHLSDTRNNTIYNIMFPEDIIENRLLSRLESKDLNCNLVVRLSEEDRASVEFLFAMMEKELREHRANHADIVHHLINVIIALILRDGFKQETMPIGRYMSVRKAVKYIKDHYEAPLTLMDVANHVNLEANYFSSLFSKNMGMGFKQFLNETRLIQAAKQLRIEDKSISEICFSCGYSSVSNFNRMFKKQYGVSPGEYRRSGINL